MIIKQTRDTMEKIYKDALRIRYQVFVKEQGIPYQLEVESPVDEASAIHFVLYDHGTPRATARLLANEEGQSAKLQRMAVLKESRGQSYGSQLLKEILRFSKNEQAYAFISLHAQLTSVKFYQKEGFVKQGDVFTEAGIEHVEMIVKFDRHQK